MRYQDEDDFDPQILKDGERYRVPLRFCDSVSRAVHDNYKQQRGPLRVADQWGDRFGLQRPGPRFLTGGNVGDKLVRDGLARDRLEAYAAYDRDMANAWKNPRPTGARYLDGKSGDDEIDDRCAAIRQALLQRGHDREDIKNYLSNLNDDDVLDGDVDDHVEAFGRQHGGTYERGPRRQSSDVATLMRDHQERMATLYAERERELQEEWRCGK